MTSPLLRQTTASQPAPRPDTRDRPRHLQLAQPGRARLSPGVVGLATGITAVLIIAAQLCLSMLQTADAYELDRLQVQQRDLSRVERTLQQSVEALASPQNLAENAAALGMVQNVQPAYLRLSDGAVLGAPAKEATEAAVSNTVPNATLGGVPIVNENGEPTKRSAGQAAAAAGGASDAPVVWKGNLPAPDTH